MKLGGSISSKLVIRLLLLNDKCTERSGVGTVLGPMLFPNSYKRSEWLHLLNLLEI